MAYRATLAAGVVSIGFAAWLASSLTVPAAGSPAISTALLIGVAGAATWAAISRFLRLRTWVAAPLHLMCIVMVGGWLIAPAETLYALPTTRMVMAVGSALRNGLSVLSDGIEGTAVTHDVALAAMVLFWGATTALLTGLHTRRPYLAVLPPLVGSTQLATMDSSGPDSFKAAVFVLIVGTVLAAVAHDERAMTASRMTPIDRTPRRRRRARPAAFAIVVCAIAAGTLTMEAIGGSVGGDGALRDLIGPSGSGDGISLNDFVSIRQQLVERSGRVAFTARFDDVPTEAVYFQIYTLGHLEGGEFRRAPGRELVPLSAATPDSPREYESPFDPVGAEITVQDLVTPWLPAPVLVDAVDAAFEILRDPTDGALRTARAAVLSGSSYRLRAHVSRADLATLAYLPDGMPSPLFKGVRGLPAWEPVGDLDHSGLDRYLTVDVATDPDGSIAGLAGLVTRAAVTHYEAGLMLEQWFWSPTPDPLDRFAYTTDIETGHGATELSLWLLEPTSPNYRRGYCENFATAMAVMARTLGIPSRVVLGFTPGERRGRQVTVRGVHAHAWVELWMPTQGWVRFDPTPRSRVSIVPAYEDAGIRLGEPTTPRVTGGGRTPTVPPVSTTTIVPPPPPPDPPAGFSIPNWVRIALAFLTVGVLFGGVVPVVKWWRRKRRMHRLHHGDISAAWEEITNRLTDLGHPPQPALTPTEYAADTDTALNPLAVVYSRSLYGPTTNLGPRHVETAQRSLASTTENLARRYTKSQRLLAWYRPGTIMGNGGVREGRRRKRNRSAGRFVDL